MTMNLAEATELAARTLAAITEVSGGNYDGVDRERVRIDLDGLRECAAYRAEWGDDSAVARLADAVALLFDEGLRRTAALYPGEQPRVSTTEESA